MGYRNVLGLSSVSGRMFGMLETAGAICNTLFLEDIPYNDISRLPYNVVISDIARRGEFSPSVTCSRIFTAINRNFPYATDPSGRLMIHTSHDDRWYVCTGSDEIDGPTGLVETLFLYDPQQYIPGGKSARN